MARRIGAAVAGQPIALTVDGAGQLAGPDTGEAHLAITALQPRENAPLDHYLVEASMLPSHLHATISVAEGAHGLIAGLAQLPDLGAIAIGGTIIGSDTRPSAASGMYIATSSSVFGAGASVFNA